MGNGIGSSVRRIGGVSLSEKAQGKSEYPASLRLLLKNRPTDPTN